MPFVLPWQAGRKPKIKFALPLTENGLFTQSKRSVESAQHRRGGPPCPAPAVWPIQSPLQPRLCPSPTSQRCPCALSLIRQRSNQMSDRKTCRPTAAVEVYPPPGRRGSLPAPRPPWKSTRPPGAVEVYPPPGRRGSLPAPRAPWKSTRPPGAVEVYPPPGRRGSLPAPRPPWKSTRPPAAVEVYPPPGRRGSLPAPRPPWKSTRPPAAVEVYPPPGRRGSLPAPRPPWKSTRPPAAVEVYPPPGRRGILPAPRPPWKSTRPPAAVEFYPPPGRRGILPAPRAPWKTTRPGHKGTFQCRTSQSPKLGHLKCIQNHGRPISIGPPLTSLMIYAEGRGGGLKRERNVRTGLWFS